MGGGDRPEMASILTPQESDRRHLLMQGHVRHLSGPAVESFLTLARVGPFGKGRHTRPLACSSRPRSKEYHGVAKWESTRGRFGAISRGPADSLPLSAMRASTRSRTFPMRSLRCLTAMSIRPGRTATTVVENGDFRHHPAHCNPCSRHPCNFKSVALQSGMGLDKMLQLMKMFDNLEYNWLSHSGWCLAIRIDMLLDLIIFLSSLLFGSMVFFSAIVMPTVFRSLDKQPAQLLAHQLLPLYYLWCIVLSVLLTIIAAFQFQSLMVLMLVILAGFVYARQYLLNKYNQARAKWLETESPQDKSQYKSLHRQTVIINTFQMIALLSIAVANGLFYPVISP